MPIFIILAIFAILLSIWIGMKLKKSARFDTVVKEITEEQDIAPKKTDGVIKDINAAEQTLKRQSKLQKEEAKKLEAESTKIGDFLADRSVVKPKKGKEADGK